MLSYQRARRWVLPGNQVAVAYRIRCPVGAVFKYAAQVAHASFQMKRDYVHQTGGGFFCIGKAVNFFAEQDAFAVWSQRFDQAGRAVANGSGRFARVKTCGD